MAEGRIAGKPFITRRFDGPTVNIAANGGHNFTFSDFNFSIPTGYKLFGIISFYSGDYRITTSSICPLNEDNDTIMTVRNISSVARDITPYIIVSFIRADYIENMAAKIILNFSNVPQTGPEMSGQPSYLNHINFEASGCASITSMDRRVILKGKAFGKCYPISHIVNARYITQAGQSTYVNYTISTINGRSFHIIASEGISFPAMGETREISVVRR